jgi:Outer membrane protein beta-barrel domain
MLICVTIHKKSDYMKRIYLSTAACLLVATCQAQILFGVQGSLQSSSISVTPPASSGGATDPSTFLKSAIGFRAGVMADIPITDQLSVRPQLLYSTKGYKIDFSSLLGGLGGLGGLLGGVTEYKIGVNYLEIPVQAMYGLDAGAGRVVLGAGPYVAYALNASANGVAAPFDDGAKRLDYGGMLSVGYELPTGISFSAYYSHGFTNLASTSTTTTTGGSTSGTPDPSSFTSGGSVSNRAFGLTLGYFFGTGN